MAPGAKNAKAAKSGISKRQFQDMLNARRELKYYPGLVETTVPANGTVNTMTQPIIVGDTTDTRDGNQINVAKIMVNFSMFMSTVPTVDFVRFVIFADNQSNGVYPTFTDVLVATDPNASYTRQVVVTKRFRILHDKLFSLTTGGNNRAITHRAVINLKNHVVNYNGSTSVEASNGKGAIYFLICGDESTNPTAYIHDWAVCYYDS